MMLCSLNEYFKKSKDDKLLPYDYIEADNERGWCTWRYQKDSLLILQCCGDGAYWYNRSQELAKMRNYKVIRFTTKRNPKAFQRKYNANLIGYILEMEVT